MKAIRIERYGAPEVLIERELPSPSLADDEVRVGVTAAGVNFADLLQRLHLYGSAPKIPYTPGFEVAGEVLECGSGIKRLKVGDRVVGLTRFGGYSTEVCISESSVERLPPGIPETTAAALPVNYLTAWFCLFEMGRLEDDEKVFIQGGAGGVGIAAIQLARMKRVEILSTAGGKQKVSFLKEQGVHHPIDYRTQDFESVVRKICGDLGLDVALESVGGKALQKCYRLMAPLGRLVSYGLSSAVAGPGQNWLKSALALYRTPNFKPLDLIGRNVGVFGFHLALLGSKKARAGAAFRQILKLLEDGRIKPVIAEAFPLNREGAVAAHHFMHNRRNIGKILLVRQ